MLKTKLASAAPVAEKIHTMGVQVMTDMLNESPIEVMFVDNPAEANARFLLEYKSVASEGGSTRSATGLLRLSKFTKQTCISRTRCLLTVLCIEIGCRARAQHC